MVSSSQALQLHGVMRGEREGESKMLVNEAIFKLSENEKFIRISHQTKYQQRSSRVNHNSHVTVRGLSYEYFFMYRVYRRYNMVGL